MTTVVYDAGLSGGSRTVTYTVLSGDTLTSIATGVANAINADGTLSAQGITASSSGTVVSLKSSSLNATTYTMSSNGTETVTLAGAANATSFGHNANNQLTNIAAGGTLSFQGGTNKAVQTVLSPTPVVSMKYAMSTGNSYSKAATGGTTMTLGTSNAGNVTATIGGTINSGNIVTLTVANSALAGGSQSVSYTIGSSETSTTVATHLTSNINSDLELQSIGVSASSSGAVITLQSYPTYTTSLSGGATETLTLGANLQGNQTVTVAGTKTTNDVVHVIVHDPRLSGGQKDISYTVGAGDTITDISSGLANAVNADTSLQAMGVSALSAYSLYMPSSKAFSGNVNLSPGIVADKLKATDGVPASVTNTYQHISAYPGYTGAVVGTETITFGLTQKQRN